MLCLSYFEIAYYSYNSNDCPKMTKMERKKKKSYFKQSSFGFHGVTARVPLYKLTFKKETVLFEISLNSSQYLYTVVYENYTYVIHRLMVPNNYYMYRGVLVKEGCCKRIAAM